MQLLPVRLHHDPLFRLRARVPIEGASRPAALEIDHDERALRTRVRQVRMAPIRREADVVEVAALGRHRFAEGDGLRDLVRAQVDPDKLRFTRDDLRGRRSRGIDHPEASAPVGDDALHANEVIARIDLVLPGVPPSVPFLVRVGLDLAIPRDFGDGDGRVLAPAREVHEDAPVRRDRHSGDLVLEARHELQPRRTARRRRLLREGWAAAEERQHEGGGEGGGGFELGHDHLVGATGGLAMGGCLYGANTARTQPSVLCLNMS